MCLLSCAMENAAKPQRVRMREAAERSIALEREHATAQRVEEEQPIGDITPNEPGINSPPNAATEVKDTPATNTRSKRKKTTSIAQEAMFAAIDISRSTQVTPSRLASRKFPLAVLCAFAGAVLDSTTGEMMEYRHLIKHPQHKERWGRSFGDEIGQLAQGRKGGVEGTDTIFCHMNKSRWTESKTSHMIR